MKTKWIICYDISNDKTRRGVFKTLKDHGQPIQYSVFESSLTHPQQQALKRLLIQDIEVGDSIRWYPLCNWCRSKIVQQGTATRPADIGYFIV